MENINRRTAILSSLAALAGAAVPKAEAATHCERGYTGENGSAAYRIVPEPTKLIPGILIRVEDKLFGPVYEMKAKERIYELLNIASRAGVAMSIEYVATEVPISLLAEIQG